MNLYDFKDKHKNERCFIACNGPSLNDIPMEKLQGETVFGLNRGYLKEGLPITYLVVLVSRVAKQWEKEILKVPCKVIFTNHLSHPKVCGFPIGNDKFSTDLYREPLKSGHTVTMIALQIAYGMGFDKVYMIGLDHSFSYENTVRDNSHHRAVISTGDDPNHFDPSYFGEGANWLPYSPKMVEKNYKLASEAYRNDGRLLLNVSTKTKLSPKIIFRGSFENII